MANKPIWIACPASMKDDILNLLARDCPGKIKGIEEYGDVSCNGRSCIDHWLQFIDFLDDGEEGGDNNG